jgi:hypothetical protein
MGILKNTQVQLVDWHISGFAIINSPVAWIRVTNLNKMPITDINIEYTTFDYEGHQLNVGTAMMEGEVQPGEAKNFIEQYLGLVDLQTEQLSIRCVGVRAAN